MPVHKPARLRQGDLVRLVSPASTPDAAAVSDTAKFLEAIGLRVDLGRHVFDKLGYLAGRDEDRLADMNAALADPAVRAIIATGGGKGAYRIADGLDFHAARADPKLLIGFSEITILQLALWHHAGVPSIHGAPWDDEFGMTSAQSFLDRIFTTDPVIVASTPHEETTALTTTGRAEGVFVGGNLDMIATAANWLVPAPQGAILLVEDVSKGLGHIDRHLTRLTRSGYLRGVVGVAVGQFTDCKPAKGWTIVDVLRDRLALLGVPILGGLPFGHGPRPVAVPIGMPAVLDADAGVLTIEAAVE